MEDLKSYAQGELIFKQGDVGDSMLMIKEGSVEVYKDTPQGEVILTVQGPGEVIGMLTFFTATQRLASARARTAVEGQLISRVPGQDPLAKLPKWVQVVLKEFTTRLDQINDQFARSQHAKTQMHGRTIDAVFISSQVASCLMNLGPLKLKRGSEDRELIALADVTELTVSCLGFEKAEVERILETFKTTGLLKVEREDGKEVIPLQGIQKLRWYVDFAQKSHVGKNRRLVQTLVPVKQKKQLMLLRDYVHKTGADANKSYTTDLEVLAEQFASLMETPLEAATIETAEKLELIEVKRSGDKTSLSFNPSDLTRTLIAMTTVRRLRSEPGTEDPDDV